MKFTKSKFLSLSSKRQHKKCAKILRIIYEEIINKKDVTVFLENYNAFLTWMELKPFYKKNFKDISDKYHYHLSSSKIELKEHNLLPSIRTGDSFPKENFKKNAIFLDNIRSAYNVGSIIRTTEAMRSGSIYFSKNTPFIDNNKVKKTAMGAEINVPCIQKEDLTNLPTPIIALDTSNDAISLFDFIFPENFTLILGNEEYGISNNLLKQSTYIVEIPMVGYKNSINVACAYAIATTQINKQQHTQNLI